MLVADASRPALETRGTHPEGAEQAEERPQGAIDQKTVLDPAHPVDEEDPRWARGVLGLHRFPDRPLDRHVDARRRLLGLVQLEGGVVVGGKGVEAKGVGRASHDPGSLARRRGEGGPAARPARSVRPYQRVIFTCSPSRP